MKGTRMLWPSLLSHISPAFTHPLGHARPPGHACSPLPCIRTAMHAPCHACPQPHTPLLPCMPLLCLLAPSTMQAPLCHARPPLQCMSPAMHPSSAMHAPSTMHAPQPRTPPTPVNRMTDRLLRAVITQCV